MWHSVHIYIFLPKHFLNFILQNRLILFYYAKIQETHILTLYVNLNVANFQNGHNVKFWNAVSNLINIKPQLVNDETLFKRISYLPLEFTEFRVKEEISLSKTNGSIYFHKLWRLKEAIKRILALSLIIRLR